MQLPKVILKFKAAARGGWFLEVAWCCTAPGGVCFLLESFCSPQNWGPPGLGDGEELEMQVCAGWLWGKLRQLHPWFPPRDCPQWGKQPEKAPPQNVFQARKTF